MEEIKKSGVINMDIWREEKEILKWGYKEKTKALCLE